MSPDEFIEVLGDRLLAEGLVERVVTVDLSPGRSAVSLDRIHVTPDKRRYGVAARVLLLITQLSDESGVHIEVIPRSLEDGSMGDEDLAAWYQRHGFQFAPTEDTPRLMRRTAKAACWTGMNKADSSVAILKTRWGRLGDGRWGIKDIKGLTLTPQPASDPAFFKFESQIELLTNSPGGNIHDFFSSFGSTDFLMKQSILPVVTWINGENFIRCIGTASVISCSGYLMTAAHVLLDPVDGKYGNVVRKGNTLLVGDGLNMGVFVPINPAYGARGFRFFGFEQSWCWGRWKESPLLHEDARYQYLTDVAICKISEMPDGTAHQPLNLSLNSFRAREKAYALGYARMENIPVETRDGQLFIQSFVQDIYVSTGNVMNVFAENHVRKDVPTPGPCFDFKAKIPGKMSGGPIFGAEGSVVRGVVSRSFSGETHGYGAMLGPAMHLPLGDNMTLKNLMDSGIEGIAQIQGPGL